LSRNTKVDYTGEDRRGERRRRMLKGATLQFNSGCSTFECVLRDITSGGARISMGDTTGVPARFLLTIADDQIQFEAIVRWRTQRDIGLGILRRAD
jgi:hypothetical protein